MRSPIRTAIDRGDLPQGYELQESDVGRILSMLEGFGTVQRGDVGKRVWSKPWGLVMENSEQMNKRKGASHA